MSPWQDLKKTNLHSLKVVTKKPAVIKELEKYFEKPEIAVQCLVEISKGNDPEGDFRNLIPFKDVHTPVTYKVSYTYRLHITGKTRLLKTKIILCSVHSLTVNAIGGYLPGHFAAQ